jgi:hypothetical protein
MICMDYALSFSKEGPKPVGNVNYCTVCRAAGRDHQIVEFASERTTRDSDWGPGLPTTKRRCTNCGFEDGPWVSASIVGGGW